MSIKDSEILELIKERLETGNKAELTVSGSSMTPLLKNGETTVTLVKATLPPKKYDIVLYTGLGGKAVLHRVVRVKEKTVDMSGDAQRAVERDVPLTAIHATAIAATTNGKTKKLNTVSARLYGRRKALKRLLKQTAVSFIKKEKK